jgi:hypothetical protein
MKVRVVYQTPDIAVDDIFSGRDADAVVTAMKQAVAGRAGFALRLIINMMSPLAFAQEVVRRYNEATKRDVPWPKSCAEFLQLGEAEGIVKILEN